jgi:hypothetical protein
MRLRVSLSVLSPALADVRGSAVILCDSVLPDANACGATWASSRSAVDRPILPARASATRSGQRPTTPGTETRLGR